MRCLVSASLRALVRNTRGASAAVCAETLKQSTSRKIDDLISSWLILIPVWSNEPQFLLSLRSRRLHKAWGEAERNPRIGMNTKWSPSNGQLFHNTHR